jgi:hypothetical protein
MNLPLAWAKPLENFQHRLGAFFKIARSDHGLCHVYPSICLHGTTLLPLGRFSWNLVLEGFMNICQQNSSFITI